MSTGKEIARRVEKLLPGLAAIHNFIAALIDGIYQYLELRWFYPGETLMVAFSLACIPYLLIRGPVNRIARRKKDVTNS